MVCGPLQSDSDRKLKFGVVGIGHRCWQHIQRINQSIECETLALCDMRQDRLDYGLEISYGDPAVYSEFAEMLRHPELNTVLVTSPHRFHAEHVIAALNAGFDVMVEKPMAMTVAECNAMNTAANLNHRILMVGEQHRYFATNRKVKELVDAGAIGRIVSISAPSFRGPWSADKRWMHLFSMSGGGLLSEACHDLDAFRWFIGARPVKVAGFGGIAVFPDQDTLDNAQVIYEFENGVNLSFGFGTFVPGHYRPIGILGTHGRLEYKRYGHQITHFSYEKGARRAGEPAVYDLTDEMQEGGHPGTDAMYEEFVACVKTRREPLTAGQVMVDSVRMCTLGQDAVRQSRVINFLEEMG